MHKNLHLFLSAKLAWKDLKNEPILSLCHILGIVAVLAPLIVIAGLRSGVLTSIRQSLLEDPHVREIVTISNRSFSLNDIKNINSNNDIAFIMPRTRTLAASLFMENMTDKNNGDGRHIMLVPSAKGDPLLGNISAFIQKNDEIFLSASAASYLHIHEGDQVNAILERIYHNTKQQINFPLKVVSVLQPSVTDKDCAFVSLSLAVAVETYQDGIENWPVQVNNFKIPPNIVYSGFRLYAKNLTDVPKLDRNLRNNNIDIISRAGDVSGLLSLKQRLQYLFILIASLGGGGLCISLGSGLWANTERKHRSLALLRYSGFCSLDLIFFPLFQSFILAFCGLAISFVAAIGAGELINHLFKNILPQNHVLFLLNKELILATICLTFGASFIISFLSGKRAAKIQPWEGVIAL